MVGEQWIQIMWESDGAISFQTQGQLTLKESEKKTNKIWPYVFIKHNFTRTNDSESAHSEDRPHVNGAPIVWWLYDRPRNLFLEKWGFVPPKLGVFSH